MKKILIFLIFVLHSITLPAGELGYYYKVVSNEAVPMLSFPSKRAEVRGTLQNDDTILQLDTINEQVAKCYTPEYGIVYVATQFLQPLSSQENVSLQKGIAKLNYWLMDYTKTLSLYDMADDDMTMTGGYIFLLLIIIILTCVLLYASIDWIRKSEKLRDQEELNSWFHKYPKIFAALLSGLSILTLIFLFHGGAINMFLVKDGLTFSNILLTILAICFAIALFLTLYLSTKLVSFELGVFKLGNLEKILFVVALLLPGIFIELEPKFFWIVCLSDIIMFIAAILFRIRQCGSIGSGILYAVMAVASFCAIVTVGCQILVVVIIVLVFGSALKGISAMEPFSSEPVSMELMDENGNIIKGTGDGFYTFKSENGVTYHKDINDNWVP